MPEKTVRDLAPLQEGNRRRWERHKIAKARVVLESRGYRIIDPPTDAGVKSDEEAAS